MDGGNYGQSQRRKVTADLTLGLVASVLQDGSDPIWSSGRTAGRSVPADAPVSGPLSCGVHISEFMIHPPIVHEALQLVMKV